MFMELTNQIAGIVGALAGVIALVYAISQYQSYKRDANNNFDHILFALCLEIYNHKNILEHFTHQETDRVIPEHIDLYFSSVLNDLKNLSLLVYGTFLQNADAMKMKHKSLILDISDYYSFRGFYSAFSNDTSKVYSLHNLEKKKNILYSLKQFADLQLIQAKELLEKVSVVLSTESKMRIEQLLSVENKLKVNGDKN